jgi:hypothetical protein
LHTTSCIVDYVYFHSPHQPALFFSLTQAGHCYSMLLIFSLFSCCRFTIAKTVTYNWDVGWVTACPDGFCRPVIGINGAWPCPIVEVDRGDTVIFNVKNSLGNETTSIHCHGNHHCLFLHSLRTDFCFRGLSERYK